MIYIYGLKCPVDGVVRYIGKSVNPEKRINAHIKAAARGDYDHHTARWLRLLQSAGLRPELEILYSVPPGECWREAERRFIADALNAGLPITNSTAGGEGLDYIRPEDAARYRQNLSEAMKVLWNLPERREEARQRSHKAWADPDIRARRQAAMQEVIDSPEYRALQAEVSRRTWTEPDTRQKRMSGIKRYCETNEARAKKKALANEPAFLAAQSERLQERWKDDAHRGKMMDARWSDDKRAKQAEALKSRAETIKASHTPEVIAKRNAAIKASWARRKAA